ncbi:hypothetical protein A3K93_11960 [Acinetobacter sp. NCu2D-2]|uniref:DUF523 domain-containing protein n=1 Tax=Acinetobacter sp. NCu2D-2 TaxID=1608473 RepID=UPI0007CDE9F7|nr:DUF523 domain-containing protein [Acinetobacter sp. NCu2D-2]ANF82830.1 hypothetical protein A3K93_11960 [Acinetobacter sp. NCu2D-2]
MSKRYFISACLLGHKVRYDGKDCLVQDILNHLLPQQYVTLCPEIAGGLPTPRPAAEIQFGSGQIVLERKISILNILHEDVSEAFIQGAYAALKVAQDFQVTHAILKANSPSCGSGLIYDGSFSGNKISGDGVTAALFKQHGIVVLTEDEFLQSLKHPPI